MGAAIKRIKMRVLGILLIISLGCLSALDVESGRFEDEHLGVNEITKVPKTEGAEVVLPQTSLKVEGTARFFPSPLHQSHLVEKNIKRIKARKNWQAKRKAWLKAWHVHNANQAKKRAARKIAREKNKKSRAKERIKKKHLWALMKKEGPAKKIKAKEKKGKKRKGKLLAKQKKANEKKAKKVAKAKARKEKRNKEKLGKRKKKRAKELKAKRKKALEKKAKLAKEKRIKKRKLRRLKAKELKDKARAKEQHTKVLRDN